MFSYVKAEMMKEKHRFPIKLLWLTPTVSVALVVFLMAGSFFQVGMYNWWYTILLPGSFTMFVALHTAGEKRKNRHGLLAIATQKKRLWIAQILFDLAGLLVTCFLFFLATAAGGFIFGASLSILQNALASLVLFLTFAWQIPLWMAATEIGGKFFTLLLSLFCNFGLAVILAVEKVWWIPFSIPARLMCPMVKILPNGLPVEPGSEFANPEVILPGIIITFVLFILMTVITSVWFEKREV